MTTIVQSNDTFHELGLRPTTLHALAKRKFTTPTPIQKLAIPILVQGDDLIGQAQTGTGKTAAFGLPIIEDTRGHELQTLILAPTRELANQIVEELNSFATGTTFKAFPIYGGVGFGRQIDALRSGKITCLVACPGRLLDLIQQRAVNLSRLRHVVLDEADRMLDMGFIRDIDKIFAHVPRERQTMLFSATMPNEIKRLAERYLHKPEFVRAETGPTATELTDQHLVVVRGDKLQHLVALMQKEKPAMSVIFTRTKHGAKKLAKRLQGEGYKADALQGNLSQAARDRVMAQFREGEIDHLVATDVAARGLDVKGITHVVNFDIPTVNEDYVHRIGRTGRMGERGRAFLLVTPDEERDVKGIERVAGVRMSLYDVGPLPRLAPTPAAQEPAYRNGGGHARPAFRGNGGAPRHGGNGGPRHGGNGGGQRPGHGGGQRSGGGQRGPSRPSYGRGGARRY